MKKFAILFGSGLIAVGCGGGGGGGTPNPFAGTFTGETSGSAMRISSGGSLSINAPDGAGTDAYRGSASQSGAISGTVTITSIPGSHFRFNGSLTVLSATEVGVSITVFAPTGNITQSEAFAYGGPPKHQSFGKLLPLSK